MLTVCGFFCVCVCVSVCSMWPPFLRVTSWSRRRVFVITGRHMSSSIFLHKSVSFPVSGPLGEELLLQESPWKVTRIQIRNESWPKVATFVTIRIAVWLDARTKNGFPEVQHDVGCMLRGTILHKLLYLYRQTICRKLRQEVLLEHMQISFRIYCFIKNILGRLKLGWTCQPRRWPSFCDCCLHGRSQEVLSSTVACSVCSQPLQNKNKPAEIIVLKRI